MAKGYTVSLQGIPSLRLALATLGKRLFNALRLTINEGAINVQREARRLCPVDTGRLRSSIELELLEGGLVGQVGTAVEYAPFVEYGTGDAGASSEHPELPEGYQHGESAGQPAQPFLNPAFEQEKPEFEKRVKSIVRRLVTK